MRKLFAVGVLLFAVHGLARQESSRFWAASWIDVPGIAPHAYGVFHFRKSFELVGRPASFVVDVSGDNRYQLFVNGKRVSEGPARGDLTHWRYEVVDIAAELQAGKNVLAAVVWNDGARHSVAQISNQTGFLLEAGPSADAVVNTNKSWLCIEDKAYSPQPLPSDQSTGYYALAPSEKFEAEQYPWAWETAAFDDSAWLPAHEISRGAPREARDAPNRWMLVAREIPAEEHIAERFVAVRKAEGVRLSDTFLKGGAPLTVPANTTAVLLIDQSYLTTGYPELTVSGGAAASIDLQYAETLYIKKGEKGNRNDVTGRIFLGPSDTYISDGGKRRVYRPLFWRTYRYVQLSVKTAAAPLTVDDFRGTFSGYPFEQKAQFRVQNSPLQPEIERMLDTGFHTARLCAHETYMDCPFYEQLQYAGDARIQMLVSLYASGDARLMKNGIELLDSSRTSEGATLSRAPSSLQQYIPPFSLWWIGMLHDYWMYVDDAPFVKQMLPGVRSVLAFYARYQKPNGSLGRMPWWNFVDWVKEWPNGEPPADPDGSSAAALDLQLLLAYQWATDLEKAAGSKALSGEYAQAAATLQATIIATDWDKERGLFADQPAHTTFSQHVNTLAILAHVIDREKGRAVMQRVIADATLAQASIYFRAYTNGALREVAMGDKYLAMLKPWREMLADGLTTWAEWNGPDTRSDCHAWGASPNFEFFRTVAGIEPSAPGFRRVRIAPNLGDLKHVVANMPHPKGEIRVDFEITAAQQLIANIELPAGITGEFEWAGLYRPLAGGKNHLEMKYK